MIEVVLEDKVIKVSPHMTIGQYQQFIRKQEVYKKNPTELLSLYLNISMNELRDLPLSSVQMVESYITNEMTKDFHKDELYETFEFNGVEYGLENDWSKLSWGAWVDLQVYSSENIQEHIHLIMSTLYRPVVSRDKKGKYKIDKYCFAKNLYESGQMTDLEWTLYQEWFNWFFEDYVQKYFDRLLTEERGLKLSTKIG